MGSALPTCNIGIPMEKKQQPLTRKASGFTFVELALVVAIFAIVGAIAVPRFSNAAVRYKLDVAAKRLISDVELAQQEAIATSSTCTLTFNYFASSYTITRLDDAGSTITVASVSLSSSPYDLTGIAASIAGNISTPIKFDGYGKPNGSGTIQLRVKSEKRILKLDGISGKVVIQ